MSDVMPSDRPSFCMQPIGFSSGNWIYGYGYGYAYSNDATFGPASAVPVLNLAVALRFS